MWETGGENVSLPGKACNDNGLSPEGTGVVHMPLHRPTYSGRPRFMRLGPFRG